MLRFDPFSDFDAMTRQLLGVNVGTSRAPRFMPMDLFQAGDHYVLNADLPGIDPGSVDITVDNGVLTLRAERSLPSDDGVRWITSERFTGTYQRQISLGEGIDHDGITAVYENGVLSVTLPVAEKAKPRRIEIGQVAQEARAIDAK